MNLSRKALSKTSAIVIVVIAIIAVVGGLGLIFTRQPTPSPTTSPSPSPTQTTVVTTPTTTKDTVKVAIGVDLDTVDPHALTTTTVFNVLRHVYEPLVWFDDKGNVIPWLAERYEVSLDGKVYTFYLKKGVKFHDGTELNAYVVKANFDRWLDPTARIPQRTQLGPISKVEVVNNYTLKVYLSEPYSPFLKALGTYLFITSSKVIESFGNKTITDVVGTGPYKFISWEKGKRVVLERNEEYWGEKPILRRIEWLIIPEASTRVAALLAGDVDFAYNLPPTDMDRVKNAKYSVITPTSNRIMFIALVPRGPLTDVRVRQALNYAVDVDAIIANVLYGLAVRPNAPLPSHAFGYADMEPYKYDPEKAKQLLRESGYSSGLKLVLMHPTGRYVQDKQVAEAIQAYLSKVGITVELKTMDWPSFVAELLKPLDQKTYDMVLLGWGPAVADAHFYLYGQFHSSNAPPKGLAAAHYNNSKVDELLDKARSELNESKRAEYYKEAIKIIWNEAPWIFLYTQKWFYAASPSLQGYTVHIDGEQVYFTKAFFK